MKAARVKKERGTDLQGVGLVLVVLRVGLKVINVNGWQARDEEFQLLLIEDGDESLGDDVIEAFKEGIQLLADGTGHLHLAEELHILFLVLFLHWDVPPTRLQVTDLGHPKLLDLWSFRIGGH